jgi:hypothetical protein
MCGRQSCQEPAVRQQGHQHLCVKHYRYGQMRAAATRRGLAAATDDELDQLLRPDFCCPDCQRSMNWLRADGPATVATLQHYRDGSLGIVCHSCNVRHNYMPGDTFREMPKDHKRCPRCEQVKPYSEFNTVNTKRGPIKVKSYCKACSSELFKEWSDRNPRSSRSQLAATN